MDFLVLLWTKLPIQKRTYVGRKYRAKTRGKKIERKNRRVKKKKHFFEKKKSEFYYSISKLSKSFPSGWIVHVNMVINEINDWQQLLTTRSFLHV